MDDAQSIAICWTTREAPPHCAWESRWESQRRIQEGACHEELMLVTGTTSLQASCRCARRDGACLGTGAARASLPGARAPGWPD